MLGTFSPLHIEPGRVNLASLLKKHGYGTAAIGKWHLGYGLADESPKWRVDYTAELSPGPLDIGFDYHFSVPANHGDLTGVYVENRFVYGLRSGKIPAGMKIAGPAADSDDYQPTYGAEDTEAGKGAGRILDLDAHLRKNERVMKVLTDEATQWLEAQPKDRPFFLYFISPPALGIYYGPAKELRNWNPETIIASVEAYHASVMSIHAFPRVYLSVGRRDGTPEIALPLTDDDAQRRYKLGQIDLTAKHTP